eukprot:4455320-Pyramimonas_sp.AAC.1
MSRRGRKAVSSLAGERPVHAGVRSSRAWAAGTLLTATHRATAASWCPLVQGIISSGTQI